MENLYRVFAGALIVAVYLIAGPACTYAEVKLPDQVYALNIYFPEPAINFSDECPEKIAGTAAGPPVSFKPKPEFIVAMGRRPRKKDKENPTVSPEHNNVRKRVKKALPSGLDIDKHRTLRPAQGERKNNYLIDNNPIPVKRPDRNQDRTPEFIPDYVVKFDNGEYVLENGRGDVLRRSHDSSELLDHAYDDAKGDVFKSGQGGVQRHPPDIGTNEMLLKLPGYKPLDRAHDEAEENVHESGVDAKEDIIILLDGMDENRVEAITYNERLWKFRTGRKTTIITDNKSKDLYNAYKNERLSNPVKPPEITLIKQGKFIGYYRVVAKFAKDIYLKFICKTKESAKTVGSFFSEKKLYEMTPAEVRFQILGESGNNGDIIMEFRKASKAIRIVDRQGFDLYAAR